MLPSAICLVVFLICLILDLTTPFSLIRKFSAFILLLVTPHVVLLSTLYWNYGNPRYPSVLNTFVYCIIILFIFYFFIRFSLYVAHADITIPLRLRIMMGGRRILLTALWALFVQIPIGFMLYVARQQFGLESWTLVTDDIVCGLLLGGFLLNGALRIACTSRRLGVIKRAILVLVLWVPVVNLVYAVICCRSVKEEFAFDTMKIGVQNTRATSEICKTKYPLILLHGIGFRDYKYINYWGRIPKVLKENGALLYYGEQEACGTLETNAVELKNKVFEVLRETGCSKVNIIAHSKGGLDARYMISSMNMGEYVCSLTTMSTPHYGSELLNLFNRLPDHTYHRIAHGLDRIFGKLGDTHPDMYTSSKELSPEFLKEFNEKNKDVESVYYQSYAASMNSAKSDGLLSVPYTLMRHMGGSSNDGLVSAQSAQWGEFKGVLTGSGKRGISHADLIDLKHQDYKGFDIAEEYVKIVADLKSRGF